jgi:AraC-like DNA-binding protein
MTVREVVISPIFNRMFKKWMDVPPSQVKMGKEKA